MKRLRYASDVANERYLADLPSIIRGQKHAAKLAARAEQEAAITATLQAHPKIGVLVGAKGCRFYAYTATGYRESRDLNEIVAAIDGSHEQ
jgi:hypothetical protein